MKVIVAAFAIALAAASVFAQKFVSTVIEGQTVPDAIHLALVRAEDSRDAGPVLPMLASKNAAVRYRAALATGRIGDERAIEPLVTLFEDASAKVAAISVFALGEIESAKGSEALLRLLERNTRPQPIIARAVEAAGKIAAANPRDARTKALSDVVVGTVNREVAKGTQADRDTVIFGLTAILRVRPTNGDLTAAKFLTSQDARVRTDAANTLARLRSRNANVALRAMLSEETDGAARANAARALGAAEDKDAFEQLAGAAVKDRDQRVRISAIRSLGTLKNAAAIDRLVRHGNDLLRSFAAKGGGVPSQKTELLEIATALSQIAPNTGNTEIVRFLELLRQRDGYSSAETETALARVAPKVYVERPFPSTAYANRRAAAAIAQGMITLATSSDEGVKLKAARTLQDFIDGLAKNVKPRYQSEMLKSMPDLQRAIAAFKPADLNQLLLDMLRNEDVNVRATAAELIGAQPANTVNIEALKQAFSRALVTDTLSDDAQLSILAALFRLNKKETVGTALIALNASNYLVRRRAFQMLPDPELQKDFPGIAASLERARKEKKDQVLPHRTSDSTRLGQVVSSDADYARALSRKNGSVRASVVTTKGRFTIELLPEDAPLTVDNFVQLARAGYFNNAEVHRVVGNFVMQDGDPTGTGSGGPGDSIRCEINMAEYDRGALGMALSGKDTGGSQWFLTHSPQPHLDGGYTVFGRVSENEMRVVDSIVRGDRIVSISIAERRPARRR